ncbi:MAG: hypothetical protein E7617_06310 [Ruminococcaceae bacterium]|nr:hypothetical protein [Oscillospiraceae bacterium]
MCKTTDKNSLSHLIKEHFIAYPQSMIRDILKFIHQGAFGCEHMVSDEASAIERIKGEYSSSADSHPSAEKLSEGYSRVSLSYLDKGLSPQTLGRLFYLSAKKEPRGKENLILAIEALNELAEDGNLPFEGDELRSVLADWEARGYPALRHTDIFRQCYNPSYRVIANEYVRLLELFIIIDRALAESSATVTLAIEGGSASGKTTLAALLKSVYGCTVFHMDDFFLRPEQRTAERFAEPGGNVDRERFLSEVLLPLSEGRDITYRPFDCSRLMLAEPVRVSPARLVVVEGAYSMHPELSGYYDLSVFLDISEDLQRERIMRRNSPKHAERFFNEWIPLENKYFKAFDTKNKCDISIDSKLSEPKLQ